MLNIKLANILPVQLSETSEFYIRNNRFKPEKKQFLNFWLTTMIKLYQTIFDHNSQSKIYE